MKTRILPLLFCLSLLNACHQPALSDRLLQSRWVDLTHTFDTNAVYWPTNIPFRHDTVYYGMTEKGYFYSSFKYSAEEHGGTHFDAPVHFGSGEKFIHEIPVEQMHGPGVVIDVIRQAAENRDYLVSVKDFEAWETLHGRIPDGAIIILNTGFNKFWTDKKAYTGTLKTGREALPKRPSG
jgi:kynurenine formamidase